MKGWLFAAALLLAACGPKLPEGAERSDADPEHHSFRLTPDGKTLLYIRGAYPRKTYLVRRHLRESDETTYRAPGRVLRGPIRVAPDGKTALVEAWALGEQSARYEEGMTLAFDLETGTHRELPPGSSPAELGPGPGELPAGLDRRGGRARTWTGSSKPTSAARDGDDVYFITEKPSALHKLGGWSTTWTKKPTMLLGAQGGKLILAVAKGDGASVWTLDIDEARMPLYRDAIDAAKPSPARSLLLGGVFLVVFFIFLAVFLDRVNRGPRCSRC